jgi:16S rRNA (uracil1498-N3)-methyltransferase
MSATPRLYVECDLSQDGLASLSDEQAHYLLNVLRLDAGAPVRLFNGRNGEWEGTITREGKRKAHVFGLAKLRDQASVPDIWLLFAPLKKTRTDFVIEKATELGVARLLPVFTSRSDAQAVRTDRFHRIAIEAAEQTERLDIPDIAEGQSLDAVLASWRPSRLLFFCDEAGDEGGRPWGGDSGRASPALGMFAAAPPSPAAILIGPEGGFTPAERERLRARPFVRPIGLGPRILRAETAALACLAIWQAVSGDWR